jgi:hypothetical protein
MPNKFCPRLPIHCPTRLYTISCKTRKFVLTRSDDGTIWHINYEFYKEKFKFVHLPAICCHASSVYTHVKTHPFELDIDIYRLIWKATRSASQTKWYVHRRGMMHVNTTIERTGMFPNDHMLLKACARCTSWHFVVMRKTVAWRSLWRRPYTSSLSLTGLDSSRTRLLTKANSCITRVTHFETIWRARPSKNIHR